MRAINLNTHKKDYNRKIENNGSRNLSVRRLRKGKFEVTVCILRFNAYPAEVFMGDAGSLSLRDVIIVISLK
ncbi:MAG: hypothetical protein LBH16_06825 [Treponema sp.]|jgi:hypothetical protein|nr:hypothetical protein [Treponema sp.]